MDNLKLYTDDSGWVRAFLSKEDAFTYFSGLSEEHKNFRWSNKFATSINDIKEVDTPFKAKKRVYDAESFSEYCSDLLDCWLGGMEKDRRYTRPVNEDDCVDESFGFMYTLKGQRMVDRAIRRLAIVGEKHYNELEIEIKSSLYQEY